MDEKLYKAPKPKDTIATYSTPVRFKEYGMVVCGFCGNICSEFDDDCGKCRQVITFRYKRFVLKRYIMGEKHERIRDSLTNK